MTDPFDALARPQEAQAPRPRFTRELRARLVAELGLDETAADEPTPAAETQTESPTVPTIELPERRAAMPATTTPTTATRGTTVTPYLTASDAGAALEWYSEALGAVEQFRVVGDDGRLGHAEFTIGAARFMLSDEYPEIGVRAPTTIGGTGTALHLSVEDVDGLYARAVAAGATALRDPLDEPYGARQGTLLDPFGHRWMLSQPVEDVDLATYRERSKGSGYEVVGAGEGETITVADRPGTGGGIWAAVTYHDALAGIRFLVDVFGFEEQLVVAGPDGETVVHSQLRWPEGGVVQVATYDPDNVFRRDPGSQGLYVVTADPQSVWERCQAAGLEVIREPESPDYDPGGMGFSVRDREGNIWSFGTYGLGAT